MTLTLHANGTIENNGVSTVINKPAWMITGGAYTPTLTLYRNGSLYAYTQGLVNYSGGHYDSLNVQAMMTFNGSSDYVDMRAYHNGGGNAIMQTQSTFSMFRVGA